MKLKLSNVNLNDNKVVENLCETIKSKEFLSQLDLSNCGLGPAQLLMISDELICPDSNPIQVLRNLNIGYNRLNFPLSSPECIDSEQFIDNLLAFIEDTKSLNHLDISGMNLGREFNPESYRHPYDQSRHNTNPQILDIAKACVKSPLLVGLHISDNGLSQDQELMSEVLDIFGLGEKELQPIEFHDHKKNRTITKTSVLKDIINKHIDPITLREVEVAEDPSTLDSYQKHLLQTKQMKFLTNNKIVNQTSLSNPTGKMPYNSNDKVILTRKINHHFDIFNQVPHLDGYHIRDQGDEWEF